MWRTARRSPAAADTRLAAQVTAINSYSTVLATWFAQVPESALHLTVADLAAQTDPVYVISYPVDAAGAIADDSEPVIYAVTQDTTDARNPIDVLASAGSANGRAYALFTSPEPMFAVSYESHGGSCAPRGRAGERQGHRAPTGLTLHFDMVVILALALLALVGGFFLNRKLRSIRR